MRPISVDELINQARPKFIKRDNRVLVTPENKLIKKRKFVSTIDPSTPVKQDKPEKRKLIKNKFNFNWDTQDDTLKDFEPLIDLNDDFDDDLDDNVVQQQSILWKDKKLRDMTARDWRSFKEEFNIIIKNSKIQPIRNWKESNLDARIIEILINYGYESPTPIQKSSIPIALNNHDIIGIAETGSGKTLAYIIPLLDYILKLDSNYLQYEHNEERNLNKPLGLILAPTRELANQIKNELDKFESLGLNSISVIGGHQYEETVHAIKQGIHMVVATPGRLIDLLDKKLINLSHCNYLIFDEADRMIDMGFEKELEKLYSYLPQTDNSIFKVDQRLSLMFTATFSPSIDNMTSKYLKNPVKLIIGKVGEKVDNIVQTFEYLGDDIDDKVKSNKLISVLNNHMAKNRNNYSIIIFANYIKTVEYLSEYLNNHDLPNVTIHGSKSQSAREKAIDDFSYKNINILIATDVAARGIDIADVSMVVNYQMTKKLDEYIHRIGRTGRAGNKGRSFTFITNNDQHLFNELKVFLKKNIPPWLEKNTSQQLIKD